MRPKHWHAAGAALALAAGSTALAADVTICRAAHDTFVRRGEPDVVQDPDAAWIVKGSNDGFNRKAWLAFDLGELPSGPDVRIGSVTLRLTYRRTPTDPGPAVRMFSVYGMTDESLDGWDETTVTWNTAPGNDTSSSGVDRATTTPLLTFPLQIADPEGTTYELRSDALRDFVAADSNDVATIILLRTTVAADGQQFESEETASSLAFEPTLEVVTCEAHPADLDEDCVVGGADLTILLGNWGGSGAGDLDGDGVVGGADLTILLGAFGT